MIGIMKRFLAGLVVIYLLAGCARTTPNLAWVVPTEGSTVSGVLNLKVTALQEPYPANVVFFADGQPIAKAYQEDGIYQAVWDTTATEMASVKLKAKAFSGPSIAVDVNLAAKLP